MFRVKLLQPEIDYETRRVIARQEIIEGNYREFFDVADKEKEFDISIRRHRQRRSLDANALFHKMVREIAKALDPPLSMARCKNILMGRYGVIIYLDDEETIPATIKTNIGPEIMLEKEQEHWKVARSDGSLWYYYMLKNTREYDSNEFSKLLSGTLEDARELGIDTVSDEEKEMALKCWGVNL